MPRLHHVTSVRNRESIRTYGLDWSRMGAARGIAGSRGPEVEGCFLCVDPHEVDWFIFLNNTGGPVDVWAVDGIEVGELLLSPEGHHYFPGRIEPGRLTLVRQDVPAGRSLANDAGA
ncbi:hypothetical protein [Phytohabitans houttuyneae]|uniref:Uncharacterized protein n=1 Tax=Phytohabitans houttuyneae TaxID=1076126 RepID=A0A6V8KN98_9ACTN|nr:hypothetical protein [Phytohabitans houttuyneae]GFJ82165.1 hypothetical protein Phou_063450 [Phytohabitans houttuyneae]